MRRARHSGHVPAHIGPRSRRRPGGRPRALIALVLAAAGLLALWLPGRNDTASATEIAAARRPAASAALMGRMFRFPTGHHRHRHRHHPFPRPSHSASAAPWRPFTHYVAGQLVSFGGHEYRVLADHTSLPAWQPPDVPLLFERAA